MEEDNEQENDTFEDDYYTFLNVPKNVSAHVNNYTKYLSLCLHPKGFVFPIHFSLMQLFHKNFLRLTWLHAKALFFFCQPLHVTIVSCSWCNNLFIS